MRMSTMVATVLLGLAGITAAAGQPAAPAQEQQAAAVPPSLADMTPLTLVTMPVIGRDDETVGRVEEVVRDKRRGGLALVVRTDEGERLALEVQQIEVVDLQLRLQQALSQEELQQRIQAFTPEDFAATAKDAELASLAAEPEA